MKKTKNILLIISYVLSLCLVIIGTFLLVRLAQGNAFDFLTGRFHPTGLIILDSKPNGAQIKLNGKNLRAKTPRRLTDQEPGNFHIELSKPGYRLWTNDNTVVAGEVTFLNYSWLLPDQLSTTSVLEDTNSSETLQTTDKKHTFYLSSLPQTGLYSTDNFASTNEIYLVPKSTDPAQAVTALNMVAVSDDGNTILIKQTKPAGSEFLALDSKGAKAPTNLTQLFKVSSSADLQFNPDNSNELFWLEAGAIRKINLNNRSLSAIIADQVVTQKPMNKKLYFVQSNTAGKQLFSTDLGGQRKSLVLNSLSDSPTYQILAQHYNGKDYLAVLIDKTRQLSIYIDTGDNPSKIGDVLENVSRMTFGPSGRYFNMDQGDKLVSYDLEKKNLRAYNCDLTGLRSWQWIDDYHLIITANNRARMIDFDGQNDQIIYEPSAQLATDILIYNRNVVLKTVTEAAPSQFTEILLSDKK